MKEYLEVVEEVLTKGTIEESQKPEKLCAAGWAWTISAVKKAAIKGAKKVSPPD